ncbi:MAG TPA: SDR family NAD(P)-dependent oxidoreductase [bacterium]|nr:SDR family NAD(P)-dependent oxidoreductase [bacterium]
MNLRFQRSCRSLQGKVVLITGASSGIGRETALAFARRGARLAVAARRQHLLESLAHELDSLGCDTLCVPVDVSNPAQIHHMVHRVHQYFGRLEILINNAGFGLAASLEETTPEEMSRIFAVNTFAVFHAMLEAIPLMRRSGYGHIINVASSVGRRAIPFCGAYSASKYALVGLSESLRVELAGSGIHVSTVFPVRTETEFFSVLVNKMENPYSGMGPLQPAARVAEAIVSCARHPRAEVLPFPWLRLAIILNAISPRLVDAILTRAIRLK